MKRLVLAVALAALSGATVRAQGEQNGPVVYPSGSPSTNSPDASPASATTTSAATMAPDTNSEPAPAPAATETNAASSVDAYAPPAPAANDVPAPNAYTPPSSTPLPAGAANPFSAQSPAAGANGKQDDIYDIRRPYFYLKSWTWLWITLGVLALIALAAWLLIRFMPTRARRAQSAYELALEKLEKARALLNEQNPEPYAVFVSETIRTYLGQRFHTPSTRRTTEEFLRQMQNDTTTPLAAHRDLLRGFLESCDLVKFAHYEPGREELEQVQQRAVSFVNATRPMEGAPA